MYDRILVATDGSEHALAAAREALGLAETHDAIVYALYVVETSTSWLAVSKNEVTDALRDVGIDAGKTALADVESLAADRDVDLVTELGEGSADEEILAYAAEIDADLAVMGTHGREGVRRRLVGSVAERVVRDAPMPVLTVNAQDA
ncbi:universal stress protein [Halocalculus aciditolerans]|uniref:Universal stress protein UspA n=1 Tax=Halocalculus aciditolerans TaxID=1383812 RepID=A0A830F5C8_9EURY|nr:universal stress protein [Halocalculus aciditolerans]GGL64982.1 universal stress protein UspA [Halocalculus aciditolerans]